MRCIFFIRTGTEVCNIQEINGYDNASPTNPTPCSEDLSYNPSPPSTAIICPVIKWGAVAKNITADAISSPVPFLRIGVCFAIRFMNAAADFSPRSIIPGATQFTEIAGARAFAITFVNMCTAAFDEQ